MADVPRLTPASAPSCAGKPQLVAYSPHYAETGHFTAIFDSDLISGSNATNAGEKARFANNSGQTGDLGPLPEFCA